VKDIGKPVADFDGYRDTDGFLQLLYQIEIDFFRIGRGFFSVGGKKEDIYLESISPGILDIFCETCPSLRCITVYTWYNGNCQYLLGFPDKGQIFIYRM